MFTQIKYLFTAALLALNTFFSFSAENDTVWRVLPIRSYEEFQDGAFGGEGEQHPHSIARCLYHPEYIYFSQDVGGTWRSVNNGESWEKCLDKGLYLQFGQSIEVDPSNPNIAFVTVDSSYNYKAIGYKGLYRTEDGGKNWTHVLHAKNSIYRMYRHNIAYDITTATDTTPAKTWYAAFVDNGLFRSDDGGITWSNNPLSSLTGHNKVYQVKTHPTDGKTVLVATNLGLFVSKNKGENLTKITSLPENVSSVCINPRSTDTVYATVYNQGLYLSTDSGSSFNLFYSHSSVRLHMNPGYPEQLYLVGSNKNTVISDNGGASWYTPAEATTFPGLGRETGWRRWIDGDLSGIVPNSKNKNEAVAFSRSTLFKTTDGGATFQESAAGFTGNAWSWTDKSIAFDRFDSNKIAFFCCDVGTRITTTGGDWFHENTNSEAATWRSQGKISWYGTYSGDFYPEPGSNVMVACIGNYFYTQLMRTENLGQNWTLVTEGKEMEEYNLFVSFNPKSPNVVYAGNKRSLDAGKTFNFVPFPKKYSSPSIHGMCNAYPNVIYAIDKDGYYILRSCDMGSHWEEYAHPGWRFRIFDGLIAFIVDPVNPNKIYTTDDKGDLATFDGNNWESLHVLDVAGKDPDFNFVRNIAIDPNNPNIIYAGTFASGASNTFRSLDGGNSWKDISYNFPRLGGCPIKVNPHTGELYRGSSIGTWIFPAPYDTVPTLHQADTFTYECDTIFNPTDIKNKLVDNTNYIRTHKISENQIIIQFQDKTKLSNINVFNISGIKIKNEYYSGNYYTKEEILDISNLPNGIYLANILTDKGFFTQKIIK